MFLLIPIVLLLILYYDFIYFIFLALLSRGFFEKKIEAPNGNKRDLSGFFGSNPWYLSVCSEQWVNN